MRIRITTIREFPDEWFDNWLKMAREAMSMRLDKAQLLSGNKCVRRDVEPGGLSVQTTVEIERGR